MFPPWQVHRNQHSSWLRSPAAMGWRFDDDFQREGSFTLQSRLFPPYQHIVTVRHLLLELDANLVFLDAPFPGSLVPHGGTCHPSGPVVEVAPMHFVRHLHASNSSTNLCAGELLECLLGGSTPTANCHTDNQSPYHAQLPHPPPLCLNRIPRILTFAFGTKSRAGAARPSPGPPATTRDFSLMQIYKLVLACLCRIARRHAKRPPRWRAERTPDQRSARPSRSLVGSVKIRSRL